MQARICCFVGAVFAALLSSSCREQRETKESASAPARAPATTAPPPTSPATPAPSTPPIKPHASAAADKLGTLPDGVGLAVGTRVPDVEVKTHLGEPVHLTKLIETGPLLLIFYRGGW
jgi:hypothetical protein